MNKLMVRGEPNWPLLLKEWERSGLSQEKFCEQRGLSYFTFCSRRRRALALERKRENSHPAQASCEVGFIPVTVDEEESRPKLARGYAEKPNAPDAPGGGPAEVEVELPFGVVLRFRGMLAR